MLVKTAQYMKMPVTESGMPLLLLGVPPSGRHDTDHTYVMHIEALGISRELPAGDILSWLSVAELV